MAMGHRATLYTDRVDAVIFGTDGVVADTAPMHAAAWKATFDEFLHRYAAGTGTTLAGFEARHDFPHHVAGKPREEAVRTFLASRGIELPERSQSSDSVEALAARKTSFFLSEIERRGVETITSAVAVITKLRRSSVSTAVVSSSPHLVDVLRAARIEHLFDVRVDGNDVARSRLAPKPDPSMYVEAARRLRTPVSRCVAVDDVLIGIDSGHRGAFGVVIGVDSYEDLGGEMYARGANVVVASLADVGVVRPRPAMSERVTVQAAEASRW